MLVEGVVDPMHRTVNSAFREDALLSGLALAIGATARTRILLSLMDGHARTSTELAALAEVTPPTASAHLNRLKEARLICVAAEGRHRYYSLGSPDVAHVLEGLSILAGGTTRKFVPNTPKVLRRARSCYDHMAGAVAVALHDQILREGWLISDPRGEEDAYEVTDSGTRIFGRLGIDIADVRKCRRRFAYACLDWSERRPHIGGAVGAALLKQALAKKWVSRELSSRALCLTRFGEREFLNYLGLKL